MDRAIHFHDSFCSEVHTELAAPAVVLSPLAKMNIAGPTVGLYGWFGPQTKTSCCHVVHIYLEYTEDGRLYECATFLELPQNYLIFVKHKGSNRLLWLFF